MLFFYERLEVGNWKERFPDKGLSECKAPTADTWETLIIAVSYTFEWVAGKRWKN